MTHGYVWTSLLGGSSIGGDRFFDFFDFSVFFVCVGVLSLEVEHDILASDIGSIGGRLQSDILPLCVGVLDHSVLDVTIED